MKIPLRSVSQLNQYTRCPQAYKLARIDKVWARPAAWLPQGTAFHTVAETYEKRIAEGNPMTPEEAFELFKEEYAKDIGAMCEVTPNFNWWTWSGPYNGERDIERRYHVGLEQVEKFIAWRNAKDQKLWVTPEICDRRCLKTENHEHHVEGCDCQPAKPAIELPFSVVLGADPSCPVHSHGIEDDDCDCGQTPIKVRGYIDAIVEVDGELRVRDYKTGNSPGDDFQLGVYALAIGILYGVKITKGDYLMAGKKGKPAKPTDPYDLSEWTLEAVTERFQEVEAGIQAGEFPADPEPSKCQFCDVSYSCPIFK